MRDIIFHEHLILGANKRGRDFVCGDIHGHYDTLIDKLAGVSFDFKRDRLFALGDLVDRGPDSLKCLRLLHETWFYSVLGNHELMMMDFVLKQQNKHYWYRNGGFWHDRLAPDEVREVTKLCEELVVLLPHSVTIESNRGDRVGLVHAEPPSDWHYAQGKDVNFQSMVWSRDRINGDIQKPIENITYVCVGHHVDTHVRRMGNVYYIDTGSGYEGGHITLLEITENLQKELETLASRGSVK